MRCSTRYLLIALGALVLAVVLPAVPGLAAHCDDATEQPSVHDRIEEVLEDAEPGRKTSRAEIYAKPGGTARADADFEYLAGERRQHEDVGARYVMFEDGTTVVRYRSSATGLPTIGVHNSPVRPNTKIRYR